jgi:hypothetical protein
LDVAFQVTNPAVVAKTLDKAMEADPDANLRMIGKQKVWEIQRESEDLEFEELDIAGVGFGGLDDEEEEEPAPLLEHAALTVAHGYLIVASHLDFMEEILPPQPRHRSAGRYRGLPASPEASGRFGCRGEQRSLLLADGTGLSHDLRTDSRRQDA